MDPRLQQAAESGSINELYALIDENPYILENIDAVPFINTPLHVAASAGKIEFAMEMLNLKPSFARKLNTSGFSPLHLAVDKNQNRFVSFMRRHDKSLVRVKGREGMTPFHFLVIRGKADLVIGCLLASPECIQDVTVERHSALYLAVKNDRFEVLQVLTGWIQRMSQPNADSIEINVLNELDFNYNSALHIAAYKNDHQAVRLLLECRLVQRNIVNNHGLTFLDILRRQGHADESGDLGNQGHNEGGVVLDLEQVVLKTGCKEAGSLPKSVGRSDYLKSPITFWTYSSTVIRRLRSQTSDEARGGFMIVCILIITATYQTALQPPGGVQQPKDANASFVVMKQTFFIILWVFNTIGFCCAIFYTFCLIPLHSLFTSWFCWIATSLCVSYALAIAEFSPHPLVFLFATFGFFLLVSLYLLVDLFRNRWRKHLTLYSQPRLSWFWND